jgi:hypothetical protein
MAELLGVPDGHKGLWNPNLPADLLNLQVGDAPRMDATRKFYMLLQNGHGYLAELVERLYELSPIGDTSDDPPEDFAREQPLIDL